VVLAFVAWRLRSVQMPRQVIAGEGAPEAPAPRPARVVA
jgi:hypothetical protein